MARYFINKRTGVLHIEGLCKESSVRPYETELFEDEEEIRGQYHRLCKNCAKQSAQIMRLHDSTRM